jgi:hypothetical protein
MDDDQNQIDEDQAIAAVRRLDATLDKEYEAPLRDADGSLVDTSALAVDSEVDGAGDDTDSVELTLGQTDDLRNGTPDPR